MTIKMIGTKRIRVEGLTILIFLFVVVTAYSQESKPRDTKTGFELSVRVLPHKPTFSIGQPVVIELKEKNKGKTELHLLESCISLDYQFFVINGEGNEVPFTEQGRRLTNRNDSICSLRKSRLLPNSERRVTFNLSSIFDFSKGGMYKISVGRSAKGANDEWATAKSNIVRISIN